MAGSDRIDEYAVAREALLRLRGVVTFVCTRLEDDDRFGHAHRVREAALPLEEAIVTAVLPDRNPSFSELQRRREPPLETD